VNSYNSATKTVSWSTSWSWSGGPYSVKSYADVGLNTNEGYQISQIKSVPSVWDWSYSGSNIVGDVSYDIWLAGSANGAHTYEVMIWLANLNAGPIGSKIAEVTIGGNSFWLASGTNQSWHVYSFVANSPIYNANIDILEFLSYLVNNQGVSNSQYLVSVQAGTEPFTGQNAVLHTTAYSCSINV